MDDLSITKIPVSWRVRYVALLLTVLQALLLITTAVANGDTVDESTYIGSAAQQWAHGNTRYNCEAPALPKWAFGAALRASGPHISSTPKQVRKTNKYMMWGRPKHMVQRHLLAARFASIALMLACGVVLFEVLARWWSPRAGLAALAAWVFSPNLIAHGTLATLDGWATGLSLLTLLALLWWERAPSPRALLAIGLGVGAIAASKVPALAVVLSVMITFSFKHAKSCGSLGQAAVRTLRDTAIVAALSLLTLWAVYGFQSGQVDGTNLCGRRYKMGEFEFWSPMHDWVEGVLFQIKHGRSGHRSYLFGEVRHDGWWWFYLAALALKSTHAGQLLTAVMLWKTPRASWGHIIRYASGAVVLLIVLSAGKTQNGVKYVLPLYAYWVLWLAFVVHHAPRFGRVFLALFALAAIETVVIHPHHLMQFNAWAGGPSGGPRYLIHGDDWGQGQKALGEWMAEHKHGWVYYTRYSGYPPAWGVKYKSVPCEPTTGVFALHAINVHRPERNPGCLDWLTVEPPDERLGHGIYLYTVDKARLERLKAHPRDAPVFWRAGRDGR